LEKERGREGAPHEGNDSGEIKGNPPALRKSDPTQEKNGKKIDHKDRPGGEGGQEREEGLGIFL